MQPKRNLKKRLLFGFGSLQEFGCSGEFMFLLFCSECNNSTGLDAQCVSASSFSIWLYSNYDERFLWHQRREMSSTCGKELEMKIGSSCGGFQEEVEELELAPHTEMTSTRRRPFLQSSPI
ncbi:hypothetical protein Q8A67_025110 [Cirrhinus molitorella]|uniref:Uncharacterized protein n=1 Tax=Cirrhinus molitorella TaxID=172907 RepID=A0AA88NZ73_9TELE|nr:hypothetical protein Q8A67_025110 [Cirrhinus molitorella]